MRPAPWALLVLVALCFANSAACRAEQVCPWMNAATAGGFLGGDVQAAVSGVTPDGDATCDFSLGSRSMMRIAVYTMAQTQKEFSGYLALCGAKAVALKGIGNEAVRCLPSSGKSKGSELIIGRVRNRAFVIAIKAEWIARPPTSPTKTRNPISDDSENIAEQVAGSLF